VVLSFGLLLGHCQRWSAHASPSSCSADSRHLPRAPQVTEPAEKNSGLLQGTLLKRHRCAAAGSPAAPAGGCCRCRDCSSLASSASPRRDAPAQTPLRPRGRRVPGPDGSLLTWQGLSVGSELQLYGRTYHLLGCDAFTRCWLQQQGCEPAPDAEWPEGELPAGRAAGG
jgi:hypothetical protein